MKRRFLAAMLAMTMVFGVAACGNSGSEEKTEATDEKKDDAATDEKKEEARTIVVGTSGGGEPYTLIDDKGNWTGVEAELWAEVEKRTGWTVEVKQSAFDGLLGELDAGRVDVVANCMALTQARLDTHPASDPIYGDAQVIIVLPDSKYQTFEDLRGQTMGVTSGQASQTTVEKMAPEYDWQVVTYEDSNAGFNDCALGRIESYANTITNIEKVQNAQGLEFRMLDERLFGNNVGWYFADTEDGKALRDELNKVIADMHADGTISKICEKWFYTDMTKNISDDWLKTTK